MVCDIDFLRRLESSMYLGINGTDCFLFVVLASSHRRRTPQDFPGGRLAVHRHHFKDIEKAWISEKPLLVAQITSPYHLRSSVRDHLQGKAKLLPMAGLIGGSLSG